ncbi:unnamed protein product [Allacma fusca]|uniref:Uncharacterized protein n=1 Tax=Allacma fusca TaxID=39272 RepID=A0A8J2PDA4_9HEXA|nr:unnamed protein product [Allacma fusca]
MYAFWLSCAILTITSICLGSWLFASIYFLELSSSHTELHDFHLNLFWWVSAEILTSLLVIIFWSHLHCRLAQKKIEQRIPLWIVLNVVELYVTFGCFLFPSITEYRSYHHKGFKSSDVPNTSITQDGVTYQQKTLLKSVAHFYFGVLLMKTVMLGGLVLSLFEHRHRAKQIDVFLNELNLGEKRGKLKRDSFIL